MRAKIKLEIPNLQLWHKQCICHLSTVCTVVPNSFTFLRQHSPGLCNNAMELLRTIALGMSGNNIAHTVRHHICHLTR